MLIDLVDKQLVHTHEMSLTFDTFVSFKIQHTQTLFNKKKM